MPLAWSAESLAEETRTRTPGFAASMSFLAWLAQKTTPPVQPWSAAGMEMPIVFDAGASEDLEQDVASAAQTAVQTRAGRVFMGWIFLFAGRGRRRR